MKTIVLNSMFAFSLALASGLAAQSAHASIRGHVAAALTAPAASAPAQRLAGEAHQWDGKQTAAGEAHQFGSRFAAGEANQFGSKQVG